MFKLTLNSFHTLAKHQKNIPEENKLSPNKIKILFNFNKLSPD